MPEIWPRRRRLRHCRDAACRSGACLNRGRVVGMAAGFAASLPLDSQGEGWQGASSLQGVYTDLAEKTNPKASGIARKPFQVFSAIPRFYWVSGLLERTAGIAEALLEERRCLCFLYSP